MLQKLDLKLDNSEILAFRLKGKIYEDDVKRSIALLEPALESPPHFNIYLEVEAIDGISMAALKERISFTVNNYKEIVDKVDKVALVSDMDRLKEVVSTIYELIPSISLEHFPVNDGAKAIDWLKK